MASITLHVNGRERTVVADPSDPLLWVLRDDLGLTGTKYGCGEGQCGACTVLANGQAIRSCITPLSAIVGRAITTIEGLADDGQLHPVQQAFVDADAFQCGYCTTGMVLGAVALLRSRPNPSDADVNRLMNAHICRCGTYSRIALAVRRAAESGGSASASQR
jgi:aerobic-type carbon monoxide dehydrogenase small subunit (CoxS/CutS family)